ncbi:MAG TPA: hypothetical protein VM032_09115 [Vicinamibacterales bacterium]|nr:hypothetical protein [Vicinamibacterales bacterium]
MPDTPVAGGVVDAPSPVPGAHGTAAPLVPVGMDADAVAPVLRSVGLGTAADADAGLGAPVCARGPLSVAVLTTPFDEVVVPVELLACDVGALLPLAVVSGLALPLPGCAWLPEASAVAADADAADEVAAPAGVAERAAVPTLVPVDPAPVTGTHGVVVDVGAPVGVLPG